MMREYNEFIPLLFLNQTKEHRIFQGTFVSMDTVKETTKFFLTFSLIHTLLVVKS